MQTNHFGDSFPLACGKRKNFKSPWIKGSPSKTIQKYAFIVRKWCTTTSKWANKMKQVAQMILIIWLSSI